MKIPAINKIYNNFSIKPPAATAFLRYNTTEIIPEDVFVVPTQRRELNHVTYFFRNPEAFEFVKDYVQQTFPHKVNVVVGGCSFGKEAWSLKMLLKDKAASVFGFDIGIGAIEKAQSGIFDLTEKFMDDYLCFGTPADQEELKYKKLFEEYFEPVSIKKPPDPFEFCRNKVKDFRVKKDKEGGCKFAQGDILKLDEFLEPNSTHVLTFRNALYHLTNSTNRSEKISMLNELCDKIKKVLVKDGVLVLGKYDINPKGTSEDCYMANGRQLFEQDGCKHLLYDILVEHGFEPAFTEKGGNVSVWRKVGD